MKKETSYYILTWAIILFTISLFDYFDHIQRSSEVFRNIKMQWFLYTMLSTASVLAISIASSFLLQRIIRFRLLRELLAVAIARICYHFTGDYIKQLTVPEIELHFNFDLKSSLVFLLVFSGLWLVINFVLKIRPAK